MQFLITKHNADPRIRDDCNCESALSLALATRDFGLVQHLCSYKYPARKLMDDFFAVGQISISIDNGEFAEVEFEDIIDVLLSMYEDIHMPLSSKKEKNPSLTSWIEKEMQSPSSEEDAPTTHQSNETDENEVDTLATLAL